jgi:hypothetical protein
VLLTTLGDDLFDIQASHRKIHRADTHQPTCLLAVKCREAGRLLCPVGPKYQVEKVSFLLGELSLLLCFAEIWVYPDEMLTLIFSEVENLERTIVLASRFQFTLHSNESLTSGVNRELTKIGCYPSSSQAFCDRCGCTRTNKEVRHKITWIRGSSDDPIQK